MKRHCFTLVPFFALIGLVLSPLSLVHASPPPTESVHFCLPFDYEQWQRDHPLPAGKQLADRNTGEPRTVRMIYFLPNDLPFSRKEVDIIKTEVRRIQTFYAEQMQAHGYGNRTFRIETDAEGEPLVHRVDGRHSFRHYWDKSREGEHAFYDEILQTFDFSTNIYLIAHVTDASTDRGGGEGSKWSKQGGFGMAWFRRGDTEGKHLFRLFAHELGHAFGLQHDFRLGRYPDDGNVSYVMSYGEPEQLSACNARFLSVHPYFNSDSPLERTKPPTLELTSSLVILEGATSIPVRIKVRDQDGLHQVLLHIGAQGQVFDELVACDGLEGEKEAVVEFDYDGIFPSSQGLGMSFDSFKTQNLMIMAIDALGDIQYETFELVNAREFREPDVTLGHKDWQKSVMGVSFSPDGRLLAAGDLSGRVTLWDVSSGETVATLGHEGDVSSVSFSPDGQLLATGGYWDNPVVTLWDVSAGNSIATLSGSAPVSFSPNGRLLATGSGTSYEVQTIKLWDVSTGNSIAILDGHRRTEAVSFSPDGRLLASSPRDGTIQMWDVSEWTRSSDSKTTTVEPAMPHTLTKASGEGQEGTVGEPLAKPFVVSVKDQNGSAFAGAVVTFSVTAGGGTLSSTTATTDAKGRARSTLTLGGDPGTNTVTATVEGLEPITFTAIGQATTDTDSEDDGGLADDEPSGEDQESEEQPTTMVELEGVSTSHDSVREDDAQATTITLTVTLDKAARTDETITLAIVSPTQGKTAKRGEDFDATLDSTLTIAKGQTTGTAQLTLTPKDNTAADGDKAFGVQATSSSGHAALINIQIIDNDSAGEPQARLTPDPSEVEFYADDPAWKTFTVHTNLDSVLVRANPSGSDPAIEVAGGQQVPSTDYCPAEGNDRPTRGRRDGWSLHVKACQAGQTKLLLIDYDTGEIVQQYEVNVEASTNAAATTALNPSYPNPFNSETVLSYTLPTAADIRLEVFTLNGQRVAVLHEGFQAAGYHTIAMDASDLASGVYLYRLTTPEGRFTQKFTLLR